MFLKNKKANLFTCPFKGIERYSSKEEYLIFNFSPGYLFWIDLTTVYLAEWKCFDFDASHSADQILYRLYNTRYTREYFFTILSSIFIITRRLTVWISIRLQTCKCRILYSQWRQVASSIYLLAIKHLLKRL